MIFAVKWFVLSMTLNTFFKSISSFIVDKPLLYFLGVVLIMKVAIVQWETCGMTPEIPASNGTALKMDFLRAGSRVLGWAVDLTTPVG